jgi:hypothetical protein
MVSTDISTATNVPENHGMLEWYGYYPSSRAKSIADLRESLRKELRAQLVREPEVFQGLVAIDAEKPNVISELDERLGN